jgi:acyl dehydratase
VKVGELAVGNTYRQVVVENLTRTQIVMYAGVSGDFNPMHTDEVYAVEVAGLPTVMAHGQLTMGLSATAVTAWLPEAELTALGVRFLRQVWPGATLTTTVSVVSVEADEEGVRAELSVVTADADGVEVVNGYARVREA